MAKIENPKALLTVLPLPIGNLGDVSKRAVEKLTNGKIFLAEDTRTFKGLLGKLKIGLDGKTILSYHDHTQDKKILRLLRYFENDEEIILVSDAGSPVISDPGFSIVREAVKNGVDVTSIPGACSLMTALEISGLPPHPFHFYGFFPKENEKKKVIFSVVDKIQGTYIFFEAPHRILETLDLLTQKFESFEFVVCRELTKKFESIYRFKGEDFSSVKTDIRPKGEFVVLFYATGSKTDQRDLQKCELLVKKYLNGERGTKALSKIFSKILGKNNKEIYKELLE